MYDANMAYRAISYALENDSTLMALIEDVVDTIYGKDEEAPADAYPFVCISEINPGEDVYYNGGARATVNPTKLVYGIQQFQNNAHWGAPLSTIAKRIDTLLHDQTLPVYDEDDETDIGTVYLYRQSPYKERFLDNSIEYRYLGGMYQVSVTEY